MPAPQDGLDNKEEIDRYTSWSTRSRRSVASFCTESPWFRTPDFGAIHYCDGEILASGRVVGRAGRSRQVMTARSWSLGGGRVADEHVREFLRAAEGHAVAGGDLVGSDAKTLGDDPAHELRREEAILGAQDEPRRHGWPGVEWPRAVVRGVRFRALLAQCLLGKGAGHIMVEGDERVITAGLAAPSRRACS
jgi:hypothetical protein